MCGEKSAPRSGWSGAGGLSNPHGIHVAHSSMGSDRLNNSCFLSALCDRCFVLLVPRSFRRFWGRSRPPCRCQHWRRLLCCCRFWTRTVLRLLERTLNKISRFRRVCWSRMHKTNPPLAFLKEKHNCWICSVHKVHHTPLSSFCTTRHKRIVVVRYGCGRATSSSTIDSTIYRWYYKRVSDIRYRTPLVCMNVCFFLFSVVW